MRRVLVPTLFVFVLASSFTGALAQRTERPDPTRPAPRQPGTEQAPARSSEALSPEEQARRAGVVARVGDVRITVGDVEDAINEQSAFMRDNYRDPEQVQTFAQSLIRFELLARAAERADIGHDPEVQRVVKQHAVQQLIRREFDERITPESISEEDIRAYYNSHPDEFHRAEMRRASHIQLESREEAGRLLAQAREADAREFRRLAREHSVDPETRLRGGDLRYFDEEGGARNRRDPRVDEALAAAAFALQEVGDVPAAPVQVGDRWSIVKLTGRLPAENRSLEQAAPTIRLRLWRERRQREMEEFVARLRRETNVEVHPDRLQLIELDPPEREDRAQDRGDHPHSPGEALPSELLPER